jgi:hypothetical protein
MVFTQYYDTWDKYGFKLASSVVITKEILNKFDNQNDICDLVWIVNARDQRDKSTANLSNTVMDFIRKLSPIILTHRKFKHYPTAGEVLKRADRHFKYDPKQRFDGFKERQSMIEVVLKDYANTSQEN